MPSISSRWHSMLFLSRGLHSRSAKNCQKQKYATMTCEGNNRRPVSTKTYSSLCVTALALVTEVRRNLFFNRFRD